MPTCSSRWSPRPAISASRSSSRPCTAIPPPPWPSSPQVREAAQIFIGRKPHRRVHDLLFGNTLMSLAKKTTVPLTLVP